MAEAPGRFLHPWRLLAVRQRWLFSCVRETWSVAQLAGVVGLSCAPRVDRRILWKLMEEPAVIPRVA